MREENMLDKMYNAFQENMSYRLDEIEIQKSRKKLKELVNDPEKESVILDYGIAYERAGFRNGFMIAVQIMSQCIGPAPAPVTIPAPDSLL